MGKNNEISEGEELIKEFLEEKDIKFKEQVKITNLQGDYKPYRTADFYLKQFKVYVEFFGLWNVENSRKDYQKKREIYGKNKIPCIYLYPDNLGILNFIFLRRLKKVLKQYNMKWQLLKCNYLLLQEKYGLPIIILLVLVIFIENIWVKIIFSFLLLLTIFNAIKEIFLK